MVLRRPNMEIPAGTSADQISIATNASLADGEVLSRIVPHWLRIFGARVREIAIVVDKQPPAGRIAALHGRQGTLDEVMESVRALERLDRRIRSTLLSSIDPAATQRRWFGRGRPVRCQAGTPILAFAAAVDQATSDVVLRCDSDMLFHECGWIVEALRATAENVDVYEPPRLYTDPKERVSSRAFVVRKSTLYANLPLRQLRLDPLRTLHRRLKGRPNWLAFEHMLERGAAKRQITHKIGSRELGFSLHALKRSYVSADWFSEVIAAVECGEVPERQRKEWDLDPSAWGYNAA